MTPQELMQHLLEVGAHFGHRTRAWNPKMRRFIYGERNGHHIINLEHTARSLVTALKFISTETSRGKRVLFVGTKRSASDVVSVEANRCGQFFVNSRWLGGTLTNYKTIKTSVDKLIRLEKDLENGLLESRTKKERLEISRTIDKMTRSFGGIKEMEEHPGILFVIDPKREHIAIKEANRLNIPVVAICDTNCDPDGIDYVIPANDDAKKSIQFFTSVIADAVLYGNSTAGRAAAKASTAVQVEEPAVESAADESASN